MSGEPTSAEQERAAIVAWLRNRNKFRPFTWRQRLTWTWWSLRYGVLTISGTHRSIADFIEAGEHHKEPKP